MNVRSGSRCGDEADRPLTAAGRKEAEVLAPPEVSGSPSRADEQVYVANMAIRVVFADDNFLVREGIAALLAECDDIELVDTVADPHSLLKSVAEHRPDAVLTDIRMPPTHTSEGIDAAKRIRAEFPDTGVVVLSQYVEDDYALQLLADGVAGLGYLLKERVSDLDELVRALGEVTRGGSAAGPEGGGAPPPPPHQRFAFATPAAHRARDRGAEGDGDRPQQRHDREDALYERARSGETHRLGFRQARAQRRGRAQPPGDGGAGIPRRRRRSSVSAAGVV